MTVKELRMNSTVTYMKEPPELVPQNATII